jgi:hypothetical protein
LVGKTLVVTVTVIVVYYVWEYFAPDEPSTYLRTDLVAAQEAATFITGFATVGVVRFDTGSGLQPFSYLNDRRNRRNVKGYCYRLYDLTIGYPSLWAAVANAEASAGNATTFQPPEVLSADVTEARQGGDAAQAECDGLDLVTDADGRQRRLLSLQQALADNGQWDSHVKHGERVLTTFSRNIAARRKEVLDARVQKIEESRSELENVRSAAEFNEWLTDARARLAEGGAGGERAFRRSTGIDVLDAQQPLDVRVAAERGDGNPFDDLKQSLSRALAAEAGDARARLADSGGFFGALKLTFSTIGIYDQEARRFVLWKADQFYIRQDFAEVTYGSDFTLDVARVRGEWFGPKRVEVVLPEPYLLSRDRYTRVIVPEPDDFRLKQDENGDRVEATLTANLAEQIERVEPHAIRFAKALLTVQIQNLVQAGDGEVSVRFVRTEPSEPDTLANLVRLMRTERQGE